MRTSDVYVALECCPLPVSASRLAAQLGLPVEAVYAELVRLEGAGQARVVLGYFPRAGHIPEAGWFTIKREVT